MSIHTEPTDRGATITLDAETAVDTLDRAIGFVRAGGLRPASAETRDVPATDSDTAAEHRRQLAAEIRIPADDDFGDDDFLDAPEMARLGEQLIADWPELGHIQQTRVTCSWKRKATKSRGKIATGKCTPLSGYAKYRAGADFHIWLAADAFRDAAFGPVEIEAMLYHECCHIGYEVDEDPDSTTYGELTVKGVEHDFAGFWSELSRYGAWHNDHRTTVNTVEQLRLGLGSE